MDYVKSKFTETLPKVNQAVAGFARRELNKAASMISLIWKECAEPSFPDCIKYDGCQICSPEQSAKILTEHLSSKNKVELSRSDVCVYAFNFLLTEPDGNVSKISSYLTLPHCFDDSNDLIIKGTNKTISPVVSDMVFSRVNNGIFVPFTRDRLTFEKIEYIYLVNGVPENSILSHCNIHHYCKTNANKSTTRPKTTLAHYLFARWGFYETFERYFDFKSGDMHLFTDLNAAKAALGEDEWDFFYSYGYSPKKTRGYVPCKTTIAIRKEKVTESVKLIVAGFFYVADIFPDDYSNIGWIEGKDLWVRSLGNIIHKDEPNSRKIHLSTTNHLNSLDQYLDGYMKQKIEEIDLYHENFYDFIFHMIENMADLLITLNPASLDNKKLSCLDYVLLDVIKSIFNFTYSLEKTNVLDRKTVAQRISKYIPRDIATNYNKHGEVSTMSFPGDCLYFKLTTSLISQTEATSKTTRSKLGLSDSSRCLTATLLGVTSPLAQTKPKPEGNSKLGIFAQLDSRYRFFRDEALQKIVDETQAKINL